MKKNICYVVGLIAVLLSTQMVATASNGSYDPWIDLNDDGIIDAQDLQLLASIYGTSGTPINKTAKLLELEARINSLNTTLLTEYYNITECDVIFVDASGDIITGYLNVDSATLYVDDVNDRVGIGTASPDEKLTVKGNIKVGELFFDDFPGTSLSSDWLEENYGTGTVSSEVANSWWRVYGFGGGTEWYGKKITYQPELSLPGDFQVEYKINVTSWQTTPQKVALRLELFLTNSTGSDVVRLGFVDNWGGQLGQIDAEIKGDIKSTARDIGKGEFTLNITREGGTIKLYKDGTELNSMSGVTDEITDLRIRTTNYASDYASDTEGKVDYVLIREGEVIVGGKVGIGTSSPAYGYKLDVEGKVQATSFDTGDITFRKDGEILWRIFEDEDGLYLENLKNSKVYSFVLQEVESGKLVELNGTHLNLTEGIVGFIVALGLVFGVNKYKAKKGKEEADPQQSQLSLWQ